MDLKIKWGGFSSVNSFPQKLKIGVLDFLVLDGWDEGGVVTWNLFMFVIFLHL
jgi:hypothetical protein